MRRECIRRIKRFKQSLKKACNSLLKKGLSRHAFNFKEILKKRSSLKKKFK